MKIILLGYGKMGHEVEQIALQRGHEIIARIDNSSELEKLKDSKSEKLSDSQIFRFRRCGRDRVQHASDSIRKHKLMLRHEHTCSMWHDRMVRTS